MNKEIWKDIPEYEGKYQVSNFGRVKSFTLWGKGRIMKQNLHNTGRYRVKLCKNGSAKIWLVHRLVLISFEGYSDNPERIQVNHLDGNPTNNNLDNLAWCTAGENSRYNFEVLCYSGPLKGKRFGAHPTAKQIDVFDLSGNYLNTFSSGSQAIDKLNKGCYSQGISSCLNGRQKTHNGYIFKKSENKKAPVD